MENAQATFQNAAQLVALGIQGAAIFVIAVGAVEALLGFVRYLANPGTHVVTRRDIWLRFAAWIVLSLEFTLGADVIGTAISPSWNDIGKLAAIAAIRTALSWFLARDFHDVEKFQGKLPPSPLSSRTASDSGPAKEGV
jgi:uncharacterized membrane protein